MRYKTPPRIFYNKELIDNNILKDCKYFIERILENNKDFSQPHNHINFFKTLKLEESLNSATIEGSPITFEKILRSEANFEEIYTNQIEVKIDKRKHNSEEFQRIIEVINLRNILNKVNINKSNISHWDIKSFHSDLFKNISSKKVYHGKFDFIGKFRETPGGLYNPKTLEWVYTACKPEEIESEIINFCKFFNNKVTSLEDIIINSAFIHSWYERIHPFYDGNGRIGRLLIPLYFTHQLKMPPIIFLSKNIQKKENISGYYEAFDTINKENDYTKFINYFIKVLLESLKELEKYISDHNRSIIDLSEKIRRLPVSKLALNAKLTSEILLHSPIITVNYFVHIFNSQCKFEKDKLKVKNFREDGINHLISNGIIEVYNSPSKSKNIYYKSLVSISKL